MKFRKIVLTLIFALMVVSFFTKPSEQDFMNYIRPALAGSALPPVIDYQDKFLYTKVDALYINAQNPSIQNGRDVASAGKEEYIGVFNKFWKVGK